MRYKLVFIGSTGGGVLSRLLQHRSVRENVHEVVSDRSCGFLDVALSASVPAVCLDTASGEDFSQRLARRYQSEANLIFISFYTKIFTTEFLSSQQGKVFNCHPSILPACKGMQGFEDTLASGSLFMGCSLHQVDEGVDTGKCQIQAALPLNRDLSYEENRHRIFLAQYYSSLQFCCWVIDQRLTVSSTGGASVTNTKWNLSSFAPNLDADLFTRMGISDEL